jgi:hypothetical protein
MTNKTAFRSMLIVCCSLLFTLTKCSKGLDSDANNPKLTSSAFQPDLLPGSCPYPCTDTRCKAYLNGYCGTGGGTTDTVAVVKNSANPVDSVGNKHNAGLNAVLPNYSGGVEPTQANSFSYTNAFLSASHYSVPLLDTVQSIIISRYDTSLYSMTVTSFSSYAYGQGQMSSKVNTYLNSLGNLINALPAAPTSTTYSSFASAVISLESTILSDNTITATDRTIILSGTSIARYSASYWVNYYNAQSSGSSSAAKAAPAVVGASWFSWSSVVGGDVVGAIAGGLGGAAAGAIIGGVGALPGAAAGAIGGGIANSVYEGGMQLWRHFFSEK